MIPLLGGLRVLTRTGGLARCLPFSLARLKLASITVPAVLAAIWAALVSGAFVGFGVGSQHRNVVDAAMMGHCDCGDRPARRCPLDLGESHRLRRTDGRQRRRRLPARALPQPVPGFDVCLIGTAPMVLGGSPLWSLAIAAIAAGILLNSMDAESLRAQQAEQRKLVEEQKKQRAAAILAKQRKR